MQTLPHSEPPTLHLASSIPCLHWDSWTQVSLGQSLVGSVLLSPGSWSVQGFVCVLQESVSPVLCSFWQLYGGVMATSSKRANVTIGSTAPRAPVPEAGRCWSVPPLETLKSDLAQSLWRLLVYNVLLELSKYLWSVWGLILNAVLPLLPSGWASPLPLDMGQL